ncbi:glucose-methanol-choline oxidoreductase [Alcanivorax sp. P2S70]|uniref:GMC family oxidoreductase n=1 Tax=Alcanivorax profundi TaxID=2338368 RepID=A0A418Y2V1_9GAMM|nr:MULTISPECIES: GMC family oxidoreductase [Alcanivorax]ERP92441.1 glucose-methanol-choline oxidoreductase [Alcanivorax sp. P2S70]RJG19867.1 GMC family oxidoreductase [Alcanivorax profundi]
MSEVKWQASGLKVHEASDVTESHLELQADVVVVGSGAGGAVAAYELARKGKKVIVLEAGPYVPSQDFTEKFTNSLETLYQDHGGQTNSSGDLLVLQGACVGGSTVVNGCVCFRTPDFILEDWQRDFGLDELTRDELAPYFDEVEKNLSVHDNGPHEIARHGWLIRAGANKLGWSVKPLKRNIRECGLTGHCLSGCKTERKQSMLVTYLPWAVAHGAKIYADTRVERILAEGGEATGVEAVITRHDGSQAATLRVTAPRVVLAAGAVQSPILLLKSGLANRSDMVGRNFACHPSLLVAARYPEPVHPWRGALLGVYVDEFEHPDKGGFVLEDGGFGLVEMSMLAEPGSGAPFMDYMANAKYLAGLVTLIHDHNVGRIEWDGEKKKIDYQLSDMDFPSMQRAIKAAARLHLASGATEVYVPASDKRVIRNEGDIDREVGGLENLPQHLRMVSYHPQGTCRMGADPEQSVVKANGETHDVRGLYVADASLLPTSIIVNPQITVYALATRIARHMA